MKGYEIHTFITFFLKRISVKTLIRMYLFVLIIIIGTCRGSNMFLTEAYGMEEGDYYRERLEFDSDGNLRMTTHDKKATSNITYRTAGWVIKRYDMPVNAPGQQCAFIKLYEYGEIQYRDDPFHPGYIYCYYYGDRDEIFNAVGRVSGEWQHQLYAYGDTVYIDSVLTVCEYGNILGGLTDSNGNSWGEVYYTFEGIAGARDWASKESLRTHFNKSVQYPPQIRRKEFVYSEKKVSALNKSVYPSGSIKIGAGEKGREYFDLEQGIPTGKSLYMEADINSYYYDMNFQKIEVTMKIPICIKTNYHIFWINHDGEYRNETKSVSRWYHTEKKVSYWTTDSLEFWYLSGVEVRNYAFENEKIYIAKKGLKPDIQKKQWGSYYEHIQIPIYDETVQTADIVLRDYSAHGMKPAIPDVDLQPLADSAVGAIRVRNDYLKINGSILLEDTWKENAGPEPPGFIWNQTSHLYEKGYIIPNTKKNCPAKTVFADGIYTSMRDGSRKNIELFCRNSIRIHTPVCAKLTAEKGKKYNQLISPDPDIPALVINKEAVLNLSAYGTHNDIKGYGVRDYSRYVADTQLKVPFEIFYNGKRIEADTWFSVKLGEIRFMIPIGVKEGKYDIKLRNYSLNFETVSSIENHIQRKANKAISNYAASDTITVEVIGRIYGLAVSEKDHRVGPNDEDGIFVGGKNLLPYESGEFKNSRIPFKLRTIGSMSGERDHVRIDMRYYHLGKDGSRKKVKLCAAKKDNSGFEEILKEIRLDWSDRSFGGMAEQYRVTDSGQASQGLQEWQGIVTIPEKVYVIPDTFNVSESITERELMKRSYGSGIIIANMEIYTVANGRSRLSYINRDNYEKGYCNMWKTEGYRKEIMSGGRQIDIKMGDVILYQITEDYKGSYRIVGTH